MEHNFNAIIETLIEAKGQFIDDHSDRVSHVRYVLEYLDRDGLVQAVPAYADSGFCINPFYISSDGKIHLDQWSIGGVVHPSPYVDIGLLRRCRGYNSSDPEAGDRIRRILSIETGEWETV